MTQLARSLAQAIFDSLVDSARSICVRDVIVGVVYTAVRLEDERCGLALTLRPADAGELEPLPWSDRLQGSTAAELLEGLLADSPVAVAIGLACANAMAQDIAANCEHSDVRCHLDLRPSDRVAMVGYFRPLVDDIEARVKKLEIFELVDQATDRLRPSQQAHAYLATCDVAVITATTLVNHSIDALLQSAKDCREVLLLGASTPMLPDTFAYTSVTRLSGIHIIDAKSVLNVVAEAGGMRRLKPFVCKVTKKCKYKPA